MIEWHNRQYRVDVAATVAIIIIIIIIIITYITITTTVTIINSIAIHKCEIAQRTPKKYCARNG